MTRKSLKVGLSCLLSQNVYICIGAEVCSCAAKSAERHKILTALCHTANTIAGTSKFIEHLQTKSPSDDLIALCSDLFGSHFGQNTISTDFTPAALDTHDISNLQETGNAGQIRAGANSCRMPYSRQSPVNGSMFGQLNTMNNCEEVGVAYACHHSKCQCSCKASYEHQARFYPLKPIPVMDLDRLCNDYGDIQYHEASKIRSIFHFRKM